MAGCAVALQKKKNFGNIAHPICIPSANVVFCNENRLANGHASFRRLWLGMAHALWNSDILIFLTKIRTVNALVPLAQFTQTDFDRLPFGIPLVQQLQSVLTI
jgi:hypothetical protein